MLTVQQALRLHRQSFACACKLHDIARQYAETNEILLPEDIRTEKGPLTQSTSDLGKFYTIPQEDANRMLGIKKTNNKAFSKHYLKMASAFCEYPILIREPAMEIIDCLKKYNYENPAPKFMLYGEQNCGKSTSLQHVVHYCITDGWIVVPTYHLWDYLTYRRKFRSIQREESLQSNWNEDRCNQPERAVHWLQIFKNMNKPHLDKLSLSKEYSWNIRDKSEKGMPFSDLIDQGIAQSENSTDIVGVILKELRESKNRPKMAVVFDAVNALFVRSQLHLMFQSRRFEAHELALIYNLKKMVSSIWSNGAIISALSESGNINMPEKIWNEFPKHDPYSILGLKGFNFFDPMVPIEVPVYSDNELLATLAYYKERKWINEEAVSSQGLAEILQLCGNNPHKLNQFVGSIY